MTNIVRQRPDKNKLMKSNMATEKCQMPLTLGHLRLGAFNGAWRGFAMLSIANFFSLFF